MIESIQMKQPQRLSKLRSTVVCVFLSMLMMPLAHADQAAQDGPFFGKQAKGKWIIGVKAAKLDNNLEDVKDADAVGVVLGYEFDRAVGNGTSTIELEYIDGDETSLSGLGAGTYDPDLLNLFFTYRSPGDLYYKFKLGVSYSNVDIITPTLIDSNEDVAVAGGIGLGYRIGDYGSLEIEYSADGGDNDFGVLGMNALLEF